uniref:Uncharacterized protein n=1 Tax=Glossina pallidipes TaxID=7398 RepID=A0A1A9ZSL2_GLOPL
MYLQMEGLLLKVKQLVKIEVTMRTATEITGHMATILKSISTPAHQSTSADSCRSSRRGQRPCLLMYAPYSQVVISVNCFIHILTSDHSSKNVPCPVSANHSPYYPKSNRNGNNRLLVISSRTSWDSCNSGQWRDANKEIDYWRCLLNRRRIIDDSL